MLHPAVKQIEGLRERKKARTRRLLIDAAVSLCLRQGYESTTVEQISEAADISPRTFSRYFTSKDAVFIAVLDDLSREIVAELIANPSELGPLEELRAAHMAVLTRAAQRPLAGLTADRIALILRVVYSSPALRQAAIEYRSQPRDGNLGKAHESAGRRQAGRVGRRAVRHDHRHRVRGRIG